MKRFLTIVLLFFYTILIWSQNISVSSFKFLDTDLTANTAGTSEIDQNGETSALIKIVTTESGFTFDCGMLGIVKTKQTPGEIWLYLPRGAQKITIKHPQLGILRNYYFPLSIEGARTYEMVLTTDKVQTIVQQDAGGQYLVLNVVPTTATVYIDDTETILKDGVVAKFLAYGKHSYRITEPLHKAEIGTFEMGKEKKVITKELLPNYDIYEISTQPENGAKVYLDDEVSPLGITPFVSRQIKKGEHKFRFQLNNYESIETTKTAIGEGKKYTFVQELTPTFAEVMIKVPNGCSLYINEEYKGIGDWKGKLPEGMYQLEAKKEGHIPSIQNLSVTKNNNVNVSIKEPTPIYGVLNINYKHVGAKIFLDGKEMGENPCILNNILIGKHKLTIKTNDDIFPIFDRDIYIEKDKVTEIEEKLINNEHIEFYDYIAREICLKKWDTNKDGYLSVGEAQNVKSLDGAFRLNKNIMNLDFLVYFSNLTKINAEEFYSCKSLTTIKLPESITEIGNNAFSYCKSLTRVEIPKTIKHIGEFVFDCCENLTGSFMIDNITYNFKNNKSFDTPKNNTEIFKYGYNLKRTNCKVIKVERIDKKLLKIYFSCNSTYEYIATIISSKAYIKPCGSNKKYKIQSFEHVSSIPSVATTNPGAILFSLTVKKFPDDIFMVDYIDPTPKGWEIYGIRIN